MMKQQYQPLFSLTLLVIFLSHCTKTLGQGPAVAPATTSQRPFRHHQPMPQRHQAGGFNILIRLLKSTQIDSQLYSQLNNSNSELTLLAPPDSAFSNLKTGSLNSLTDSQKVELLQYHLIPDFLTTQNFQTLSNPVSTQAGDAFEYPLNITTSGNAVNISTGLVNTSISGTVYSDGQLAVYQVDSVLQPYGIFAPKTPPPSLAPAPAEEKHKKKSSSHEPVAEVKSGAVPTPNIPKINGIVSIGVALAAAAISFL
ncbi:fasciclin-like arabinogalactan protein 12 [Pyrus ussuriensis x Pyrus communis]|uniref:Fasciclin-like arabinogalactan protein 12 n=1 Tax=Pyrus ussuriensis x Pyrus communis TaxID=2448454 RepID=A0A5N5G7W0_9ROSA|nr:fasciclin-like arabinogalactan protein 12 [Pyrus ussuriensis x Pyrus communis]